MSSTDPTQGSSASDPVQTGKGKGKATDVPQDVSMGEEESSSEDETGAEDEVCLPPLPLLCPFRNNANTFTLQPKEERKLHDPPLTSHQTFN